MLLPSAWKSFNFKKTNNNNLYVSIAKTLKPDKASESTREKNVCRALSQTFLIRFWRRSSCQFVFYFCPFIFKSSQGDASDAQLGLITNVHFLTAAGPWNLGGGSEGPNQLKGSCFPAHWGLLCVPKLSPVWQKTFILFLMKSYRGISSLWGLLQEGAQLCVCKPLDEGIQVYTRYDVTEFRWTV